MDKSLQQLEHLISLKFATIEYLSKYDLMESRFGLKKYSLNVSRAQIKLDICDIDSELFKRKW